MNMGFIANFIFNERKERMFFDCWQDRFGGGDNYYLGMWLCHICPLSWTSCLEWNRRAFKKVK